MAPDFEKVPFTLLMERTLSSASVWTQSHMSSALSLAYLVTEFKPCVHYHSGLLDLPWSLILSHLTFSYLSTGHNKHPCFLWGHFVPSVHYHSLKPSWSSSQSTSPSCWPCGRSRAASPRRSRNRRRWCRSGSTWNEEMLKRFCLFLNSSIQLRTIHIIQHPGQGLTAQRTVSQLSKQHQ